MKRYKLGEICEIVSGSTPKTSVAEFWDGPVKWITPAELNDETYIINDSVRKITKKAVEKTGLSSFPAGTVILSSRAPIGKVAIAGCEMYCNQGFKNLICSEKINNRYLYWFLKGNTEYLNSLGRGATFKEISKQIVSNIEINVPVISCQIEVANQLEKVSSIISVRKKELQKLDELVKARFIEMFGNNKYEETSLSELTELITKGTTPTTAGYSFLDKGINFFKIESINDNHSINLDKVAYIGEDCYKAFKRSQLKEGDILFSIAGAIGRSAIIQEKDLPGNTNQALAIIRLRKNCNITQKFLISILESPMVVEQYNKKKRGVAQMNLSLQDIGKLHLIVPPIDEQNEFEFFVKQVDKSREIIQKKIDTYQELFDKLMQEYFG